MKSAETKNNRPEVDKKPLSAKDSGMLFSGSALFPVAFSFVMLIVIVASKADVQGNPPWYVLSLYAAAQLSLATLFAVFFSVAKKRMPTLDDALVKKFKPCLLPVLLLISFGMIFGLSAANDYFIRLLELLGLKAEVVTPPLSNVGELLLSLTIVALLPALCEELLFRGFFLKGLSGMPLWKAVLLSGFAFSLYHHNPAQTVYPFLVGCLFGYVAIKSGSVLPTFIMHFINNAFVLIYSYIVGESYVFSPLVNYLLLGFGLLALILGVVSVWLIYRKPRGLKVEECCGAESLAVQDNGKAEVRAFFIYSAIGIVVLALEWFMTLAV